MSSPNLTPIEHAAARSNLPCPNRRAAVRYLCPLATHGTLQLPGEAMLRGWIINVCVDGVGLLLDRPLEVGREVVVYFGGTAEPKASGRAALVRHATPRADGEWLIGCELAIRLTEDQLEELLAA